MASQVYRIADIICSKLNQDNQPCYNLSNKIATSLIRVSATRIFSEPEQSILELPVNSLDAYGDVPAVGKFGLGWYSFLYWLIGHPGRELVMFSQTLDETWLAIITDTEQGLMLDFTPEHELNLDFNTGTIIFLKCHDDPFTDENVTNFNRYLKNLRFVKNHKIIVNGRDITSNSSDATELEDYLTLDDLRQLLANGINLNLTINYLLR